MIEAVLLAFKAMGWGMRIAVVVGPLLALGTGYGVWHHQIYQRGYDQALSDVAEENAEAIGKAVARRGAWKECHDRGGHWTQSSGSCK